MPGPPGSWTRAVRSEFPYRGRGWARTSILDFWSPEPCCLKPPSLWHYLARSVPLPRMCSSLLRSGDPVASLVGGRPLGGLTALLRLPDSSPNSVTPGGWAGVLYICTAFVCPSQGPVPFGHSQKPPHRMNLQNPNDQPWSERRTAR